MLLLCFHRSMEKTFGRLNAPIRGLAGLKTGVEFPPMKHRCPLQDWKVHRPARTIWLSEGSNALCSEPEACLGFEQSAKCCLLRANPLRTRPAEDLNPINFVARAPISLGSSPTWCRLSLVHPSRATLHRQCQWLKYPWNTLTSDPTAERHFFELFGPSMSDVPHCWRRSHKKRR